MNPTNLLLVAQTIRPVWLLAAGLLYALGVGIAHFLGADISLTVYLSGQTWVTLLQVVLHFIHAYFTQPKPPLETGSETPGTSMPERMAAIRLPREIYLWSALLLGVGGSVLTIQLLQETRAGPGEVFLLGAILLAGLAYILPPLRLETSGYGELVLAAEFAALLPALGFILQTGTLHRLVTMSAIPLAALFLAMLLAHQLSTFASDQRRDVCNLLARLGWQQGMLIHNLLVGAAFLLLSIAVIMGMPSSVGWPAFLALPLGGLQLWEMRRIADGRAPNWRLLRANAIALFAGLAYLLTLAFWLN